MENIMEIYGILKK